MPGAFPAFPLRFHFLDVGAVTEHDPTELKGSLGANDLALKPFLDRTGDQPGMVNMGMGQQDVLERLGPIPPQGNISFFNLFPTLKHPAIN